MIRQIAAPSIGLPRPISPPATASAQWMEIVPASDMRTETGSISTSRFRSRSLSDSQVAARRSASLAAGPVNFLAVSVALITSQLQ